LGVTSREPLVPLGEDLQLVRLFNELAGALEKGFGFVDLLHASQTLAHLLALMIRLRYERPRDSSDTVEKVAQAIIYMSEHLHEPPAESAITADDQDFHDHC
jgi:hypothetical protein